MKKLWSIPSIPLVVFILRLASGESQERKGAMVILDWLARIPDSAFVVAFMFGTLVLVYAYTRKITVPEWATLHLNNDDLIEPEEVPEGQRPTHVFANGQRHWIRDLNTLESVKPHHPQIHRIPLSVFSKIPAGKDICSPSEYGVIVYGRERP